MQLAVASQDAPWAIRFIKMAQEEAMAAEDPSDAIDLDAESASCPACGDEFSPQALQESGGRCPGCGLQLGAG
mgnify:FL=1